MAVQGWYNHYDDPDEFWDEEPLEVPRSSVGSAPVAPATSPAGYGSRSAAERFPADPLAEARVTPTPARSEMLQPDRGASVDDVDLQQAEFERLRAIAQQRIESAMAEVRTQTFVGMSSDRTATVRVSSSGVVLDIQLANGFGDLRQPAWVATGEVNSAADAIVEAVNAARSAAASAVAVRLSTVAGNR